MARQYKERRTRICKPDEPDGAQSWSIPIKKGWKVVGGSFQRTVSGTAATTGTWAARVDAAGGGAAGGIIAATTTEGAVGSLVNGAGSDLATSGGFLVTADGNIVITYTPGDEVAIAPEARFTFEVEKVFPF